MDTPKRDNRYLITEDNGATMRLMRFVCNADGTPYEDNGFYHIRLGEAKSYADTVKLDMVGYSGMMDKRVWEQDWFESQFKILKVFESNPFHILVNAPEPPVYFVPDGTEYED